MVEFNFKSQRATTIEQSERLIALGLRKETADMIHVDYGGRNYIIRPYDWLPTSKVDMEKYIPAWSLHRLIEMVPQEHDGSFFSLSLNDAGYSEPGAWVLYERVGTYDSIINCIEWLIKEGCFNKAYMEE